MASIALKFIDSGEVYNANRLFDGVALLKKADSLRLSKQIGIIDSVASSIRTRATGGQILTTAEHGKVFQISKDFDWSLIDSASINLNGKNVSITFDKTSNSIKFLGDGAGPIEGLNIFDSLQIKYTLWMEDNVLRTFENPYKKSYAIIVAIDQYEHTGYPNLGNMVGKAREFASKLVK